LFTGFFAYAQNDRAILDPCCHSEEHSDEESRILRLRILFTGPFVRLRMTAFYNGKEQGSLFPQIGKKA
ncbi:MAG: hypothetical protein ACI3VA_08815, partial [Candidatus Limivicinus sp.]